MLCSADIIRNAYERGLVIPAFNVPYLPMVEPIIHAVEDLDSFALIETARLEWCKGASGGPEAVMEEFMKWYNPDHVRLHLDRVPVIDEDYCEVDYLPIIQRAIELGYHSVMVDGSRLELNENIEATREVVETAHAACVACEAELGAVFGHKTGLKSSHDKMFDSEMGFTRVEDAERFVKETGCDWLSVAIGAVHGAAPTPLLDKREVQAKLNLELLEQIHQATQIPLVLHGGSSVKREYLMDAFKHGVAKFNIGTENRQKYENVLHETNNVYAAQSAVYEHTCWLISEFLGCGGSRSLVSVEETTAHTH